MICSHYPLPCRLYSSCLFKLFMRAGACVSCSQLSFQGLALHTGTLNLCSDLLEVAGTGYSFTSSLALDIKSLLQVLLPPYLTLRAKRQSHRSHRKIQFLQKQQFSFFSTRGRLLITPSPGGLEEGRGHQRHTGLLIKIQFKGKLSKAPENSGSLRIYPTLPISDSLNREES